MSATVAKFRERAERARLALVDAEKAEQAETEAVVIRNAERRMAFWTTIHAEVLPASRQAASDARHAFAQAVADGDGATVVTSWLAARRAEVTYARLAGQTVEQLRTIQDGVPVYPAGLRSGSGDPGAPDFARDLNSAVRRCEDDEHDPLGGYVAPLRAELETEQ